MVGNLLGLLRRHVGLVALVGVGALLRVLIGVAYGPAFYFSDTRGYFEYAELHQPSAIRPYGYSALLNLFELTGSVWPIVITQHLMGLACGVIVYALVLHKGGPRWLALLAAAPIVLDAYELVVEHYLLGDALFTLLLLGGFAMLIWQDRLTVGFAVAGGLLLAGALLTRTVGVPLVLLIGIYVLIRRVGWRPLLALAAAAGLPLMGYLVWFHSYHGAYSFSTWQDRWMYGRVMSIADCSTLDLNPQEQKLCQRPNPAYAYDVDFYVWSHNSPINDKKVGVNRRDAYTFTGKVIAQQPVDYARLVAKETWAYFSPGFYLKRSEPTGTTCPDIWRFPDRIDDPGCTPRPVATSKFGDHPGKVPDSWDSPLAGFFRTYGFIGATPGPLLLGCLVLVVVAAVRRPRAGAWRLRGDALLLAGSALTLLAGAVATSQFDIRYGLPVLVLLPLGAALAVIALRQLTAASDAGSPEKSESDTKSAKPATPPDAPAAATDAKEQPCVTTTSK